MSFDINSFIDPQGTLRGVGVGLWIPQEKIIGWRIQFRAANKSILTDSLGHELTYTHKDPVPFIIDGSWKLDSIGLVAEATLNCTRHPFRDPFSFAARFEVLSLNDLHVGIYHEVWEGMFIDVSHSGNEGGGALYSLKFKNLREKYEKKYWQSSVATKRGYWDSYRTDTTRVGYGSNFSIPPTNGTISVNAGYNLLSLQLPDIALPLTSDTNTGSVKTNMMAKVSEIMQKTLEPYADASWGIDANRRALAGSPGSGTPVTILTANCKDLSAGSHEIPPYVTESRSDPGDGWQKYDYERSVPNDFTPEVAQDGPRPQIVSTFSNNGMPYAVTGVDFTHSTTVATLTSAPSNIITKGTALYITCDPQAWYKQSALVANNTSTYEPETAIFTVSLTLNRLPKFRSNGSSSDTYYELVVDTRMWVSRISGFDLDAVGPLAPLTMTEPSPIHPDQSANTIEYFKGDRQRLSILDVGLKKVPTVDFVIDPSYFTQTSGKDFSITGWGDEFYIHMAFSCFIEGPDGPLEASYYTYTGSDLSQGLDRADITINFSAQFGEKISQQPNFQADVQGIEYPFFVGPSFDGWVDGILITPALISGSFKPTSDQLDPTPIYVGQYCAGVDTVWSAAETKSAFRTGIPPYKNSRPISYDRTRRY